MESKTDLAAVISEPRKIRISVRLGRTIQTAPYETARIDVGIEMDGTLPEQEMMFSTARMWCESRIVETLGAQGKDQSKVVETGEKTETKVVVSDEKHPF